MPILLHEPPFEIISEGRPLALRQIDYVVKGGTSPCTTYRIVGKRGTSFGFRVKRCYLPYGLILEIRDCTQQFPITNSWSRGIQFYVPDIESVHDDGYHDLGASYWQFGVIRKLFVSIDDRCATVNLLGNQRSFILEFHCQSRCSDLLAQDASLPTRSKFDILMQAIKTKFRRTNKLTL